MVSDKIKAEEVERHDSIDQNRTRLTIAKGSRVKGKA